MDFFPNAYDIGNPFGMWHEYDDNHFLKKIFHFEVDRFPEFYQYHLNHTLENKIGTEADLFTHVWYIVGNRIAYLEKQDPFSTSHRRNLQNINKLQLFQRFMSGLDKWNARPFDIIISEKEQTIQNQKIEIEKLQERLAALNEYEISQKITIEDEYLPTVIHLFQQIRGLELPSGRKLLRSDHKSPYSKMISKYYSHGGKDIPIETARNYFVEKKDDIPSKGTAIQEEHQIFTIIPTKEPEK